MEIFTQETCTTLDELINTFPPDEHRKIAQVIDLLLSDTVRFFLTQEQEYKKTLGEALHHLERLQVQQVRP